MRRTKIIATGRTCNQQRGPGCAALIAAGVDVFRLNFSHGSHEAHGEVVGAHPRARR
jgi:pyruvate kinase